MARGYKTGGRSKGSLNKVTAELRSAVTKSGEAPLEYMLRVMNDENEPLRVAMTWQRPPLRTFTRDLQARN